MLVVPGRNIPVYVVHSQEDPYQFIVLIPIINDKIVQQKQVFTLNKIQRKREYKTGTKTSGEDYGS